GGHRRELQGAKVLIGLRTERRERTDFYPWLWAAGVLHRREIDRRETHRSIQRVLQVNPDAVVDARTNMSNSDHSAVRGKHRGPQRRMAVAEIPKLLTAQLERTQAGPRHQHPALWTGVSRRILRHDNHFVPMHRQPRSQPNDRPGISRIFGQPDMNIG